jgi:serine/threonine protein kinase
MTILAEPPSITAAASCPAEPAPAVGQPRRRSTRVAAVGLCDRGEPADAADVDVAVAAGLLLRHPDQPPTEGSDGVGAPHSGCFGTDPDATVDRWPLRVADPAWVDGYRLVSRLGAGGMADVFYALASTGGPVAVKLLRAGDGVPRTCQREYLLASAVDAGCTAPALGHGLSTAGPYLVTAYLPGYRCGSMLVGRPIPAGQVWALGSALARVLAAVHARGVVHCDVKPSNLLIRGEDVRLIDFGIARHVGQRCGGDGTVECSRGWAAPEQLRTEPATPAVDVFAWGCLLAYLAGGVHPFASQDEQEWILRVQSAEPDLVGIPPVLAEVIRQALGRDPGQRPTAADLATICRSGGAAPRRPAPPARPTGPAAAQRRRLPNRLATGLPAALRALLCTLHHRDRPPQVVVDPPARNTTVRSGRRRWQ